MLCQARMRYKTKIKIQIKNIWITSTFCKIFVSYPIRKTTATKEKC